MSFEGANEQVCCDLMKLFDVFLTIPSLFMDSDDDRRRFYGKAGEMRLCDWGDARGFEARTLSNFWIDDPEYVEWVFNQLNAMIDYYNEHGIDEINAIAGDVITAINTSDRKEAGKICDKFNLRFLINSATWTL